MARPFTLLVWGGGIIHSFSTEEAALGPVNPTPIVEGLAAATSLIISADGTTLYVGTGGNAFYAISTSPPYTVTSIPYTKTSPPEVISCHSINFLPQNDLSGYAVGSFDVPPGSINFFENIQSPHLQAVLADQIPPDLYRMAIWQPTWITNCLQGNNRVFANYLNTTAPITTRLYLARLNCDPCPILTHALESANPLRNVAVSYAAQLAQTTIGKMLNDHLHQNHTPYLNKSSFSSAKIFPSLPTPASQESAFLVSSEEEPDLPSDDATTPDVPPSDSTTQEKTISSVEPWFNAFGEFAREKSQHQLNGFNIGSGGVIGGCDYHFSPNCLAGGGFCYTYSHLQHDHHLGCAGINQETLVAYAQMQKKCYVLDFGLFGSFYRAANKRHISFPGVNKVAHAAIKGWQLTPHFEARFLSTFFNFLDLEPFCMADWVNVFEQGFREHQAGPLNMGQKGRYCSFLRSEAGLSIYETVRYGWGRIVFQEKASYVYQKGFRTGNITAFLVFSMPGTFTASALQDAQNLGVGEFSVVFFPHETSKAPYGGLYYQGEFGSMFQSHTVFVSLGKEF